MIAQPIPTMYFFGVTTGKSSSRKMFPAWAEILGLGTAQLVGVDLPLNAPAEQYRSAVEQIKDDPNSLGALVTTHKINVFRAARDLFDEVTPDAALCQEVASIFKRDGRLIGHAMDPTTSGLSLEQFIRPGYWSETGAEILCLGAGGSAVAIVTYYLRRSRPDDQPGRIVLVNRSPAKLAFIRELVKQFPDTSIQIDCIENSDPRVNDALMAEVAPKSLVINATGMGKDTPGSPVTDNGVFPLDGIAWELNYRGELDFLHQAIRQQEARRLTIVDGWYYFLIGWAEIVGQVFDVAITPERFRQLAASAESIR